MQRRFPERKQEGTEGKTCFKPGFLPAVPRSEIYGGSAHYGVKQGAT